MDIYEPVITELRAQIDECQRTIATLELMRAKGTTGPAPAAGAATVLPPQGSVISFSNDAFFGMTIVEAAKKYLAGNKKTATARVISDALLAGGFKTSAKNPVENVRSIISRNAQLVCVNGEYGLAEWYPGRKVSQKKSGAAAQSSATTTASGETEGETINLEDLISDPASEPKPPSVQ
jgi:hypothetical protein